TQLIDTASRHKLSLIQKNRHLSAHPVISDEDTLFEPTEEMVRNDIRNSMEVLFTKPPFLTQKILNTILSDLEKIKDLMPGDKALLKYLDAKYLKSLNKKIMLKLFRGFWKFVFRLEDEKASENRKINLRALKLIYNKDRIAIQDAIKTEVAYYSSISNETQIVKSIIEFVSLEKEIYDSLNDAAKELIKPVLHENLSYFGIAFFLQNDPRQHMNDLTKKITDEFSKKYGLEGKYVKLEHVMKIRSVCRELGFDEEYRRFGIACYISSGDFDRADTYYDRYIKKNIKDYTADEFIVLLNGCNSNFQVYSRRQSKNSELAILKAAKLKLPEDHDFEGYTDLPIDKMDE
ncbi:MAG: hypothetical protein PF503_21325, partial [Desulfobacula sp.]|nr:hypothetical protein [Desulfobacula sp.]